MKELIRAHTAQSCMGQNLFGNFKLGRLGILSSIVMMTLLPYAAQADVPLAIQRQNATVANPVVRAAAVVQPNLNCTLIVPAKPLTAQGLATPYQLVATDPNQGACTETNKEQAAFVQAAVIDPATGQISVYNPLIIDQGTQPATPPVVPVLPQNAIVALWFGNNAQTLTLQGTDNLLASGCINGGFGGPQDQFGQVAHCNAIPFFLVANRAVRKGQLKVPPLGIGKDGKTCPSVRDFSVVDQDQSDNVNTTYRLTEDGKLAQDTQAVRNAYPTAAQLTNASDNRLVAVALDTALGCSSWKVNDLADPGQKVSAQPLNELQARSYQSAPVALVPSGDPMVLTNGQPNLLKLNLYRLGVDQPLTFLYPFDNGNTARYCRNLHRIAPAKLQLDEGYLKPAKSPMPDVANSLYTFMGNRLNESLGILNCKALTGLDSPITVTRDPNTGVVIDIQINAPAVAINSAALNTTLQSDLLQTTTAPVNVGPVSIAPTTTTAPTGAVLKTAPMMDSLSVDAAPAPVDAAPVDAVQLDTIQLNTLPAELAPLADTLAPLAAPSTAPTTAPLQ